MSSKRMVGREPNIQNIPIRTEEGRKARDAFTQKQQLLDVDYGELEARFFKSAEDSYTLEELEARPTLCVGQADDLKIEVPGKLRVWLSRCSVEDGEPCNNKVTEEVYLEGRWRELRTYPAK